MKILYLYSGARKSKFSGRMGVDYPDTPFYGLNHLGKFGVQAEAKEFDDLIRSRLLRRVLGFRLKHVLLCFFARNYDLVFGPSILYTAFLKGILCPHTKFVLFDISTTRTIEASRSARFKYWLLARLLHRMDGIVCVSRAQADFLKTAVPRLAGRISYVPLGVDVHFYQPNYRGRLEYLLAVGRDNGRDYATVVETARRMSERAFHIVCSKRNLAGIRAIPPNVSIEYDLPPQELKRKYAEAKALLLITHPDRYTDGADCSGQTVLLDAMASGLPILVSRKKYLENYVTDRVEALIVDCYDPEGIRAGIGALDDRALARDMAARARERAEREFSTERMAENLAEIFARIAGNYHA